MSTSTPDIASTIYVDRKSLHDVIIENLESENKKTFVHRMIYIFEYNEICEDVELGVKFREIIAKQNSNYHDERTTGILVLYDKIGIHMIEGSDYALMRHIELLYRDGNINTWIPDAKVKLLVCIFHIGHRLQKDWSYTYAYPDPPTNSLNELMEQEEKNLCVLFDRCLEMLVKPYGLASLEIKPPPPTLNNTVSTSSEESLNSEELSEEHHEDEALTSTELKVPPTKLISILINSEFLTDLVIYRNRLQSLPIFVLYHECIWPIPNNFMPDYREVITDEEVGK